MQIGDVLTAKNLQIFRPVLGLPLKYYDILLGIKVIKNLKKGVSVEWNLIV